MTWTRPDFASHCVNGYHLTYDNLDVTDFGQYDVNEDTYSYTLVALKPCSDYNVTVSATTMAVGADHYGATAIGAGTTLDVAPGPPVNLHVAEVDCDSVTVCFDYPYTEPQCAIYYEVDFLPISKAGSKAKTIGRTRQFQDDFCPRIDNLEMDTEYQFTVWFISGSNDYGPPAQVQARTLPFCV